MKWNHAVAVATLWVLAPAPGQGADLTGGLGGEVEFDSNARRTPTNEQEDAIFRIAPYVELREDEGKLNYGLRYRFPWERAINVQRVDGFRHFVNARAEYSFTERTVLSFSDDFSYSDSVNSISGAQDGVGQVNTFGRPVTRNNMRLALAHNFTPRFQTTGRFSFRLFDSDLPTRANNRTFGLGLDNTYLLTARHRVGGGLAVDYQDFDASNNGGRTASQTLFANVFGSWSWLIDETTTLEIAAGPTFIDTNQDAANPVSVQDGVPFFQQNPNDSDSPLFVSDLGSCQLDTIAGQPEQILPASELVCSGSARIDRDGYRLSSGGEGTWAGDGYDVNLVSDDIDAILAAGNATDLGFGPPPSRPASLSSTSWTIFAQVALSKRWTPNLLSTASYNRRDSTASGIAGSAVIDFVSLLTTWQISELWNASLRADWTQRKSTSPVDQLVFVVDDTGTGTVNLTSGAFAAGGGGIFTEGIAYNAYYNTRRVDQSIDTTRWGLQGRIRRRITRNLSTALRYTFNRQRSKSGTAGNFSDFNDHLVTLNVNYDFDRWNIW